MSLKKETKGSLEKYFELTTNNGLFYEPLKKLAIESNSYALGNVNSIVKNIEIKNNEVDFVGGREEDFSNVKTPKINLSFNTFLEILSIYSNETKRDKSLFEFIESIYKEKINSKEILQENLFIITSRKIFNTLNKEFSDFADNLVKREMGVKRNLLKRKDAMALYEQSFDLFKAIYSLFIKYEKFIKSPKYNENLDLSEKKTAFKIFQENSMASKDKILQLAKKAKGTPSKNIVVEKKVEKSDFREVDFYSEKSAENDIDVDEVLLNLETFNIQDKDKVYFIYDEEQFSKNAREDLIKNEAYVVDGTRYLQKNNNFYQFLRLLEIFKRDNIEMFVDTHDLYYINSLNNFLLEYKMLVTNGKLESVYDEPENTSYLSSLGLFSLPKNLSIFEQINDKLNIKGYINPLYFNLSYVDNPLSEEIALESLRDLEKGQDKIIQEREDFLKKNRQKIIDDEIAVFYSTHSYEVIQDSFIDKEKLKNSKAFPIQAGEFLSVTGPKSRNLLFRDNKLIIDGRYINDSERKEFYSIAFVSLDEKDKNNRAESSWSRLMEENSLYRAIFNISSKNLANIFKSINGYAEGYVFNKTKLEYNKKAKEVVKKYHIEPFDFVQPTIVVTSENKSQKLEISRSNQLLVQTNPQEIKKRIYFLYNDWTEENSPVYVEEDYIGNDEEYDIIDHVRKEKNKNLHQFLEQVTIFEHIDAFIEQIKINEIDYHFYRNINKETRNFLVERVMDITNDYDKELIEYIYSDSIFLGGFQELLNLHALEQYRLSEFPFYKYESVRNLFYAYINGKWDDKLKKYKKLYKNESLRMKNYQRKLEDFGPTEQQKEIIKENMEFTEKRLKSIRDIFVKTKSINNIHVKKEYVLIELILERAKEMAENSNYKNVDINSFIEQDRINRIVLLEGEDE